MGLGWTFGRDVEVTLQGDRSGSMSSYCSSLTPLRQLSTEALRQLSTQVAQLDGLRYTSQTRLLDAGLVFKDG